ncbi:acyl carrier protein [Streptomyces sp. YIM 98790]|uniref:acyl carrier protein n=1 Tax=Streptomyces sp. YIM 98790 TaxID=2689077 RepID=UPI00140CD97F|nr:acyl carrier protein [Streptomyces sp. YIM 98790]
MYDELKEILVSRFRIKPEQISPAASVQDLGLDSMFLVELSLLLEKRLNVSVGLDDLLTAHTLNDIVRLAEGTPRASA